MCYNGDAVPCTHHRFLLFLLCFSTSYLPSALCRWLFLICPSERSECVLRDFSFRGCSFTAFPSGCVCEAPTFSQKLRDRPTTFPKIRTRFISLLQRNYFLCRRVIVIIRRFFWLHHQSGWICCQALHRWWFPR